MARRSPLRAAGALSAATKFVAYFRVSTDKQGFSGLGLEAQREAVSRHVAAAGGVVIAEFTEVETGTNKRKRPQMAAALAACRLRRAALVIAKLDRLARNVHFVTGLMESGIEFVACDNPHASRMLVQMMAVFAEHEAKAASERTEASLAVVKAAIEREGFWVSKRSGRRITKLGNPNLRPGDRFGDARAARKARSAQAQQFAEDMLPVIREMQAAGCDSLGKIAKALTVRGFETPGGAGRWDATQVRRVMARASA